MRADGALIQRPADASVDKESGTVEYREFTQCKEEPEQ